MALQYRILGPLEVRSPDGPVLVRGAKVRALLAALLLERNRPVDPERLATALWGEDAPHGSGGAVRMLVSRLRVALGDADALVTSPAGYLLRVDELDADRFEALVGGVSELAPAEAARRLREALELWRGPALADVAGASFVQPEIARLEELRLAAVEARVDAELACGRHAELVGELQELTARYPLRERLEAQLMLALYRAGRQAEALAAFRDARVRLVEELGLEPGPGLRSLERRILAHDPALDLAEAPGAGRSVAVRQVILTPTPATDGGSTRLIAAATAAVPLPPAVASELGHGAFVGREAILARLHERWARACAGERQIVLLCGEAGIGKTRLASQLGDAVHKQAGMVLYGRADVDSPLPYQPLIAAVQHYVAHTAALRLPDQLVPELRELARFLPALRAHLPAGDAPSGDDAETRRYRLFEAVTQLLASVAGEQPTLLVLDDLQWADTSTTLLVRHLLREPLAMKLLVVATVRVPWEVRSERWEALMTTLARDPEFERIDLEGLDTIETHALIAAQHDQSVSDRLVRRLRDGTDGNPFFIKQSLRSLATLVAPDADVSEVEQALSRVPVPEGVDELLVQQVTWLSAPAQLVLEQASIIGREFGLELLEVLTELGVKRLIAALEECVAAGLVREVVADVDRFAFTHALVQESLYQRQTSARRVRTHREIAEALVTDAGAPPAEIAHHFFASRHLDRDGQAITYAIRAAELAETALAYEEAARHYRRALAGLGDDADPRWLREHERGPLLRKLGKVLDVVGDWEDAANAYARALELAGDDVAARGWAEVGLGELARKRGAYDEAGNWLQRAGFDFAAADIDEGSGLVLHQTGTLAAYRGDYDGARRAFEDSLEIRRRLGETASMGALYSNLGLIAEYAGDYERARELHELGIAAREEAGDKWGLGVSRGNLGHILRLQGNLDEARRCLEDGLILVSEVGDRWMTANAQNNLANVLRDQGDLERAAALYAEALRCYDALGDARALAYLFEDVGALAAAIGDAEGALRLCAAADATRAEIGTPRSPAEEARLVDALAGARARLGEAERAAAQEEGRALTVKGALEQALDVCAAAFAGPSA